MITCRVIRAPRHCDSCGRRATRKQKGRRGYYRASFHGEVCVCVRCANAVREVEAKLRDEDDPLPWGLPWGLPRDRLLVADKKTFVAYKKLV